MDSGEQAERLAVVRIDGGRLLEQRLRDHVILSRHPPVVRQRPHHQIPCVHVIRGFAIGAKVLRGIELRLNRSDDGLSNLVLNREHIDKVPVVSLRPNLGASGGVAELRRNAYTVAVLAHATLDHIADAQFLSDLLHVDGSAFEYERRVARDHEEPTELGQGGDDVFANAVGEIRLLRIAAHVDEGEHGDGWAVGRRQRRTPLLVDVRFAVAEGRYGTVLWDAYGADEAEPFARDGADQFLVLAAVANRVSRALDATGQGRGRHA